MCAKLLGHVQLFVMPLTSPARLLCPWDSPGMDTGVGCHFFLQGIFPTQGSNQCLLTSPVLAGRFFTTSDTWEALLGYSQFNSVVVVSSEQQRDSAIRIHVSIVPQTPPIQADIQHWVEFHVLEVCLYWLSTLNIAVCTWPSQTP